MNLNLPKKNINPPLRIIIKHKKYLMLKNKFKIMRKLINHIEFLKLIKNRE